MSRFEIEFTTPLFSKGFYEDLPEVRPPSIRGQLHGWHRALGFSYADEKAIYGGVHNGGVHGGTAAGKAAASKIVIRVSEVKGRVEKRNTLPHKHGGEASPKTCFLPGTSFSLHALSRLGGLSAPHQQQQWERTLEAWLLMGSLGLRATRGAGSFIWRQAAGNSALPEPPATFSAFEERCRTLIGTAPTRLALLDNEYSSAEAARHDASDTIGGRDDYMGKDSLAKLSDPLGCIRPYRKTSPLRFRIISLGGSHRILALWDARTSVTHNSDADLQAVIGLLVDKKKAIGRQLAASTLAKG